MAARRRTGSFSPNTSLRLRSSKVDMLLDIVFSVSDRRTGGPFKPGSGLSGDVHTSQSRANEQTRLSACHGASTPASQNPACRGPRTDTFSRERAESFRHFLPLPSPVRLLRGAQSLRASSICLQPTQADESSKRHWSGYGVVTDSKFMAM